MCLCQYIIIWLALLLLLTSCTIEQIYTETLLLVSFIWSILTIFPGTEANFPSPDTIDMFRLSQINTNRSSLNLFKM